MKKYLFLFLLVTISFQTIGQNNYILKGYIRDAKTQEALPLANIIYNDSMVSYANEIGYYAIAADTITSIQVFYLGYETQKKDSLFIFFNEKNVVDLNFDLTETSSILSTAVVTSSNYEKSIIEEPTTIEVIKPAYIKNNNITSLDGLIERVSGIQIVDGQASIRSSGFSQGAGSRVGIIVNGLPLLGGESSDVRWNFIPIENIDQIEVIKGAGSVLYGSAAMNGVINVRTAWPTNERQTTISSYSGIMDSPQNQYRQWWNGFGERPKNYGVFLSHRQRAGKLDFVLGGNVHRDISHIQGANEERNRINFNIRYRYSDDLVFELSSNFMNHVDRVYLSWTDADTGVLVPQSPLDEDTYYNVTIDPTVKYYAPDGSRHLFKGRIFNTTFESFNNTRYPAYMLFGEYQYQKNFNNTIVLTGGIADQMYFAQSLLFGQDSTGTYKSARSNIFSMYGQADMRFLDNKLNIILGARWEFIDAGIEDYAVIPPIVRVSATYKLTKNDILRGSFGQGYRLPSLAERFVERDLIRVYEPPFFDFYFGILPNPELKPEYGWSAELGYKKVINTENWKGYIDFATFLIKYNDMSYLTLDYHRNPPVPVDSVLQVLYEEPNNFGYKYINLEQAMIAGFEVSANINGKIGKLPFRLWAGYTYTYPGDLDSIAARGESFFQNALKAFTLNDETVLNSLLNYRSTHVARSDIEFYINDLTVGFSANYDGYLHRIDPILEGRGLWGPFIQQVGGDLLLPGVVEWRENNPKVNIIYDLKLAYQINKYHQLHFIVNNLLNRTYSIRPGRINPLRTFNVKYVLSL